MPHWFPPSLTAVLLSAGLALLTACSDSTETAVDGEADSGVIAALPSPEPTPVPEATPTPTPSQPTFPNIRSVIEMMSFDQADRYIQDVSKTPLVNWSGVIAAKVTLDTGEYGVTVEMDPQPQPRPDLILQVDQTEWENLQPGSPVRFSGTIKGFGEVNGMRRIVTLHELVMHE